MSGPQKIGHNLTTNPNVILTIQGICTLASCRFTCGWVHEWRSRSFESAIGDILLPCIDWVNRSTCVSTQLRFAILSFFLSEIENGKKLIFTRWPYLSYLCSGHGDRSIWLESCCLCILPMRMDTYPWHLHV